MRAVTCNPALFWLILHALRRDFITHRPWCEHPDVESLGNFIFAQRVIDSRQVHEHTSCGTDSGSPHPLSRIAGFASDHVVGSSGSASCQHTSLPLIYSIDALISSPTSFVGHSAGAEDRRRHQRRHGSFAAFAFAAAAATTFVAAVAVVPGWTLVDCSWPFLHTGLDL